MFNFAGENNRHNGDPHNIQAGKFNDNQAYSEIRAKFEQVVFKCSSNTNSKYVNYQIYIMHSNFIQLLNVHKMTHVPFKQEIIYLQRLRNPFHDYCAQSGICIKLWMTEQCHIYFEWNQKGRNIHTLSNSTYAFHFLNQTGGTQFKYFLNVRNGYYTTACSQSLHTCTRALPINPTRDMETILQYNTDVAVQVNENEVIQRVQSYIKLNPYWKYLSLEEKRQMMHDLRITGGVKAFNKILLKLRKRYRLVEGQHSSGAPRTTRISPLSVEHRNALHAYMREKMSLGQQIGRLDRDTLQKTFQCSRKTINMEIERIKRLFLKRGRLTEEIKNELHEWFNKHENPSKYEMKKKCEDLGISFKQLYTQLYRRKYKTTSFRKSNIRNWLLQNDNRTPSEVEKLKLMKETGLNSIQLSMQLHRQKQKYGKITNEGKEYLLHWLQSNKRLPNKEERNVILQHTGWCSSQLSIQIYNLRHKFKIEIHEEDGTIFNNDESRNKDIKPNLPESDVTLNLKSNSNAVKRTSKNQLKENRIIVEEWLNKNDWRLPSSEERDELEIKTSLSRVQLNNMLHYLVRKRGNEL